jgi:hypothetical protein
MVGKQVSHTLLPNALGPGLSGLRLCHSWFIDVCLKLPECSSWFLGILGAAVDDAQMAPWRCCFMASTLLGC